MDDNEQSERGLFEENLLAKGEAFNVGWKFVNISPEVAEILILLFLGK